MIGGLAEIVWLRKFWKLASGMNKPSFLYWETAINVDLAIFHAKFLLYS